MAPSPTNGTTRLAGMNLLALGMLWLGLINQLRVEWTINPQYSYGWGVPLLALYTLWLRWRDRPAASPASHPSAILAGVLALALLILPIRLVQEANPDWRLVSWVLALVVTGMSLLGWLAVGGRPWLAHFLFPTCFILIAVPWPTPVENRLIQSLMRGIAGATVECMNWSGIPAVQIGNLIRLDRGVVGVNEACSGVRSFQSTLMAGLFLGELYRLRIQSRVLLIIGGVAAAAGLNFTRTYLLTTLAAKSGVESINAWHDPAGYAVFIGACLVLWGLAAFLQRKATGKVGTADHGSATGRAPWPAWVGWGLAAWLLVVEGGTEVWYRSHESQRRDLAAWKVEWPKNTAEFTDLPISEEVRLILRYSTGASALWSRADGSEWLIYEFEWEPGRTSAQLARNHSPEVCLPASGLSMIATTNSLNLKVGTLSISFRTYVFEQEQRPLYVFFCLWEQGNPAPTGEVEDLSRASRFRAVRQGRRHGGQQVLEIAISGSPGLEQARAELEKFLRGALRARSTGAA